MDEKEHIADLQELVMAQEERIRLMKKKIRLLKKAVRQAEHIIDLQGQMLSRGVFPEPSLN